MPQPFQPPQRIADDSLHLVAFHLTVHERHFIYSVSALLGISQSELMRRVLHSLRDDYAKAGLYSLPKDGRSLSAIVDALAKSKRPPFMRQRVKAIKSDG